MESGEALMSDCEEDSIDAKGMMLKGSMPILSDGCGGCGDGGGKLME